MEGFSRNPLFGVWNILHIWTQELNQESKLWRPSALGLSTLVYEGDPVPSIAVFLCPISVGSPAHGVTWCDLGAARTLLPHRRAAGAAWVVLAAGTELGFVVSSTISLQHPESRPHLTWANPVWSLLSLTKTLPCLLFWIIWVWVLVCFAHFCC